MADEALRGTHSKGKDGYLKKVILECKPEFVATTALSKELEVRNALRGGQRAHLIPVGGWVGGWVAAAAAAA